MEMNQQRVNAIVASGYNVATAAAQSFGAEPMTPAKADSLSDDWKYYYLDRYFSLANQESLYRPREILAAMDWIKEH